jgi:hypothetical protein
MGIRLQLSPRPTGEIIYPLVYFPERMPDGAWIARQIFTKRIPHTVDFS